MKRLLSISLMHFGVVGIGLGVSWLLWQAYLWLIPQLLTTGPDYLLHLDYWVFTLTLFLVAVIGKTIFGRRE